SLDSHEPASSTDASGRPPRVETPAGSRRARRSGLVAPVPAAFELVHHLREVVARWRLQRWERLEGLEPLEPQLLADRQHVPVVEVGGRGSRNSASDTVGCLLGCAYCLLERVAPDVLHQRPVEGDEWQNPTLRT